MSRAPPERLAMTGGSRAYEYAAPVMRLAQARVLRVQAPVKVSGTPTCMQVSRTMRL